jgi:hypothetical protein
MLPIPSVAWPGFRVKLHFIPTYCPHLNLQRKALELSGGAEV